MSFRGIPESEWLRSRPKDWGDVVAYARYLREERNRPRKSLLALCAMCRASWHLVEEECNRRALEGSENYADGAISRSEFEERWRSTRFEPAIHCEWVCDAAGSAERLANWSPLNERDRAALAEFHLQNSNETRSVITSQGYHMAMDVLDFDFFGSEFRPEWRTSTVVALAREIYYSRDHAMMPVLADALEDAGCDDERVLGHCRGPGLHVRGCWVVDCVLGKE